MNNGLCLFYNMLMSNDLCVLYEYDLFIVYPYVCEVGIYRRNFFAMRGDVFQSFH